jgi:isoquinoline 1-oxidoreductase beta subunit
VSESIGDPSEISYQRMAAVLKSVGETIGWNYKPGPGRGMGVAIYTYKGTHCAVAAEVGLTDKGAIKVRRMAAAIDPGTVVNPLAAKAQIEGGMVMGLSAALRERITVKSGKAQQSSYNDYPVVRMPDVPAIEVVLLESGASPTGIGEMGVPGVAPAVANAIFAATGERIRSLPLFHAKPGFDAGV